MWDVEGRSGRSLLSTVESHSRAVQGLSWSSQNPDLFASCSNDTYINVWDTREPKIGWLYKFLNEFNILMESYISSKI